MFVATPRVCHAHDMHALRDDAAVLMFYDAARCAARLCAVGVAATLRATMPLRHFRHFAAAAAAVDCRMPLLRLADAP